MIILLCLLNHQQFTMLFNPYISRVQKELSKNGFSLLPHQKKGIAKLIKMETNSVGGILADEMGLGKTIQTIGMILANPKKITLIVVPASLVLQWESEIQKFAPSLKVLVHWKDRKINTAETLCTCCA